MDWPWIDLGEGTGSSGVFFLSASGFLKVHGKSTLKTPFHDFSVSYHSEC